MRNGIVYTLWEHGPNIDRMLDPVTMSELASIFVVNIGLVNVVERYCIKVDVGDDMADAFHMAVNQERGHQYSYKDVVRDRRGARILAESFVEQRHVWRLQ